VKNRTTDPSVSAEPHLADTPPRADPSEARADRVLARARRRVPPDDERAWNGVWSEPALSPELAGQPPAGALTYADWLNRRRSRMTPVRSWLAVLGIAAAAGPWAILGAIGASAQTGWALLAVVLAAPLVEEMAKVSAVLYVVEKRPYLFRARAQVLLCVAFGAFVFAAVENLLYFHVYVPDPSPALISWRWSVCMPMHVGASVVAGLGLCRMWDDVWARLQPARASLAFPYLVVAMLMHGGYNAFAVALQLMGLQW
jgi:hypothetical protein